METRGRGFRAGIRTGLRIGRPKKKKKPLTKEERRKLKEFIERL